MKDASACRKCRYYGLCTNAKRGRTIVRLKNEQVKDNLDKIYNSEVGQTIYSRRKLKVELPFGHMKRTLGAGQFLLRGIDGAKAELSLLSCSFNISRMLTLLGSVTAMRRRLQAI